MDILENNFKDIIVGTELFRSLGVNDYELKDSVSSQKLMEIASFLNEHPDPLFVISKVRNNKNRNMSNLDFLSGYVGLQRRKSDALKKVESINKDLSYYE